MKHITSLLLVLLLGLLLGFLLFRKKGNGNTKTESSSVLVKELKDVNKLITIEGDLSEVYTYKETQNLFFDLIPVKRKAIIVADAKARVAYDMNKVKYQINEDLKTITLVNVPEPEVIIEPNLRFYDLDDTLLPFNEDALNELNERAIALLEKEAKNSSLMQLAEKNLALNIEQMRLKALAKGWSLN